MAFNRIILWLGNSLILVACMLAMTAMSAVALGEFTEAVLFAGLTLSIGLVGIIFTATTRHTPGRESKTDALAFLLIFWIVLPVIFAAPYLVVGPAMSPYTAYFEAVSAVTTTGASTLDPDQLSGSLHIWRSFLQWMGGVIAATFAVVILAALNLRGTGVHRSMLFTFKKGELFGRLLGIGRVIAGIYAVISAFCFMGLLITGSSIFESLCLALTSVSTGGLTPRGGVLANYVHPVGAIALGISCLLGAFNVAILWDIVRLRNVRSLAALGRNIEFRAMAVLFAVLCLFGIIYTGHMHLFTVFIEGVFFVSSAGFDYHVIGLEMIPSVLLIAVALIGGSALSTAGGVKLIRLFLLFRHLGTDLNRLSHPSRTMPVMFRGQALPDTAFLSIWMYFFGYTIIFATGIMALSAAGQDFQVAVAASASSLANMGPLLDATLPTQTYAAFTVPQQVIAAVLMLIGRVEVLAAFAILSPGLWRS
ncbi:MAG: TrkH family potassium uptake protein [Alphaproteobacteria bacterium]